MGRLGRLIPPRHQNISLLLTVVIGVVASLIGGVILALIDNNNSGAIAAS